MNDFLTYINGRVMPHSEAAPILQRIGSRAVGGYYDTARTFGGRPFALRRHLARLFRGLAYSRMDAGISIDDLESVSVGLVEANFSSLEPGAQELTVTQSVTVARPEFPDDLPAVDVAVYCAQLDFTAFARSYIDGVRLYTPDTYPSLPTAPGGTQIIPLMTNAQGFVTECRGANFMFVADGRICLPDRSNVLPGVSMQTVLDLAKVLGIAVDEGSYTTGDIYEADEAFVSSTRYCMLPVSAVNGCALGRSVPGPVTVRLLSAWKEVVGIDFVAQALASLDR